MAAPLILIETRRPETALNALHDACAAARAASAALAIVQLVPVGNPVLLGDPHAYWSLTVEQQMQLDAYAATAEDYGLAVKVYAVQSVERRAALIGLIEMLCPEVAYIPAEQSGPAWWRCWRQNRLANAFLRRGCRLVWYGAGQAARLIRVPDAADAEAVI